MIDKRATLLILALAAAAAGGGWWLQRALQAPPAQNPYPQSTSEPLAPAKSGGPAPELALPDLDGQVQHLSQWRGKRVLLNFWATWCAPCRKEMPRLSAAQSRYARDGVQVIGVALDQPQSVRDYLKTTKIEYPVLIGIDADPVPTETFGDQAGLLPYSVLIGPRGNILHAKLGELSESDLTTWLGNGQ